MHRVKSGSELGQFSLFHIPGTVLLPFGLGGANIGSAGRGEDHGEGARRHPRLFKRIFRSVNFALCGIMIAALSACAAQVHEEVDGPLHLADAGAVFKTGYQDINDIYIDDVRVSDLTMAGLSNLTKVSTQAHFLRREGDILLTVNGLPVKTFEVPEDMDITGWAILTARALDALRSHVDPNGETGAETLYETVFDGLLEELDGYSRYSGREEARDNRANREGFGGIGVRIRLVDEGVRVIMVMEETPAEAGGLMAEDLITHIDGESVLNMSQRDVVRRLRGPVNSAVALEVARGDSDPIFLNFEIKRSHIVPQTVRFARDGNRAYIRISGFNQSTTRALRDALLRAEEEIGPQLSGYILDLRGNPGGLLDQAVTVSDLFLSNGRIVSTHGRHPDSHQYFDAAPETLAHQRPVVVLVNGNSASASEIVAAALQDTGRAVVIGTSSFGKGSVQTVLRLPNNGELTLTWARFHAPSGYSLHGRGVLPDICTSGQEETPDQVIARLQSGLLPLSRKVTQRIVDTNDRTELSALRSLCPARHSDAEVDVEVARRLLDSPGLFALARGFDDIETVSDSNVQTSAVGTTH